jgi:superfamily II DNA or RNA helicase
LRSHLLFLKEEIREKKINCDRFLSLKYLSLKYLSLKYLFFENKYLKIMKLEFKTDEKTGERMVYNPATRRWKKVSTENGRRIVGYDICQVYEHSDSFVPKEHQKRLAQRFISSPHRGMALVHGLGSGKTCTYASIIDAWLSNPKNPKKIIIVTSGSLRENFISQYCSFCGKNRKDLLKFFTFISYNNTSVLHKLPDLKNALIIVDEIHNILNAKKNDSGVISELYDRIEESGSRIVVGSGTIIVSHIEELYWLSLLIKPKTFKTLREFYDQFEDIDGVATPRNPNNLLKRFDGVIDYMKSIEEKGAENDYPKVTIENILVPIDDDESRLARIVHWRQYEMSIKPPQEFVRNNEILKAQKTRFYLAVSMLHSRQTSNFVYPSLDNAAKLGTGESNLYKTLPEEEKSKRYPDKSSEDGGWITKEVFDALPENGEKIYEMLTFILENPGKHVIYTTFRSYYGEQLISTLLDMINISHVNFTGDLNDAERANILAKFNAESNKRGKEIKVLIMTDSGAEGITLLSVRHQHILEQSISEYLIDQVMGRGNRYRSHNQLPIKDRTINIRRYFLDIESVHPDFKNEIWSPDICAYNKGIAKKRGISYLVNKIIPMMKIK